ncbi:unnamed protein product [Brassica oleracea var. botrytis]|uniref:BnaCnng56600D protein n=1 Tax=Brassica napus TaxID=3708 RepID=A0A078JN07_BRANA|nr:BnaCnng56600D [Brassica napus]
MRERSSLGETHGEEMGETNGCCSDSRVEISCHVSMLMGRPSCGGRRRRSSSSSPVAIDSVMYWYSNLESGKFWVCAQVKQRNPLYVGLGISYYDAKSNKKNLLFYPGGGGKREVAKAETVFNRQRVTCFTRVRLFARTHTRRLFRDPMEKNQRAPLWSVYISLSQKETFVMLLPF